MIFWFTVCFVGLIIGLLTQGQPMIITVFLSFVWGIFMGTVGKDWFKDLP